MKQRVISALVALLIVIPVIILGGNLYYAGVLALSVIAYYEMLTVRQKEKTIDNSVKFLTALSYIFIVISACKKGATFNIDYRLFILDLFVCYIPLIVFNKKEYDAEDALVLFAVTMFLGMGFNYLIVIRKLDVLYLVYVMLATFISDTFALFVGSQIGKHKLCPNISPNKTVEGMIGGVFFGTFISSVFFTTFVNPSIDIYIVVVMSLTLSLVAEFGDLVFSSIKRKYGVKDYGKIMPGHGGVLDRVDSLFFALLAFSFLMSFF